MCVANKKGPEGPFKNLAFKHYFKRLYTLEYGSNTLA